MNNDLINGSVSWESPSNIAIVKYWGKHGFQYPNNASISLTLSNAVTRTTINYSPKKEDGEVSIDFSFEGTNNAAFQVKIEKYLALLAKQYLPFITGFHLEIDSLNTFPHSSGIASSASSMSALALGLCDIEAMIAGIPYGTQQFLAKASTLARIGSGSACRSVYPQAAMWGKHPDIAGSSDEFAIGVEERLHPVFKSFHDDILIISADKKSVSSTAGHALMEDNPYSDSRYRQANDRTRQLYDILSGGDVDAFGKLAEDEALTLHALMMCSDPSYILMEEGSLSAIKAVRSFRAETKLPLYFTLDAGPNIHLLYPDEIKDSVAGFVDNELRSLCSDGTILKDHVGNGPKKTG